MTSATQDYERHFLEFLSQISSTMDFVDVYSKLASLDLKSKKEGAIATGDEQRAKFIWCVDNVLAALKNYVESFYLLKTYSYSQAWSSLESVEIALSSIKNNFGKHYTDCHLNEIETRVRQWQKLFPYRLFISPEFVADRYCSICGQKRLIRNPCGHIKGEIYSGKLCLDELRDINILALSLVRNPSRRRSVLFSVGSSSEPLYEENEYSLIRYAIDRLTSPFEAWQHQETRIRHPHSNFPNVNPEDSCPCESEKQYKDCCLYEDGVLRPHHEFTFTRPLPDNALDLFYVDLEPDKAAWSHDKEYRLKP